MLDDIKVDGLGVEGLGLRVRFMLDVGYKIRGSNESPMMSHVGFCHASW